PGRGTVAHRPHLLDRHAGPSARPVCAVADTPAHRSSMSGTGRALRGGVLRLLPTASDYRGLRGTWRRDVAAGGAAGGVALPLALAFGISSGVGAAAGLVTAVVAGFVAAVFGGSHVQVSGPTGAMAVVLAPIVAVHGAGSVALVTVLAGAMVLLGGVI